MRVVDFEFPCLGATPEACAVAAPQTVQVVLRRCGRERRVDAGIASANLCRELRRRIATKRDGRGSGGDVWDRR